MKYVIALMLIAPMTYAEPVCRWVGIHVEDSEKLQRVLQCLNNGVYEDIPFVTEPIKNPARMRANKDRCGDTRVPKTEREWKC